MSTYVADVIAGLMQQAADGTVPEGSVVVDRARVERLLAVVDALAQDPGRRLRDDWAAMDVFDAFDALEPGDRDPLH